MRKKQGRVFFFFLVSDLGEEFAKICTLNGLKKHLHDLYMRYWLHSARVSPHLETLTEK